MLEKKKNKLHKPQTLTIAIFPWENFPKFTRCWEVTVVRLREFIDKPKRASSLILNFSDTRSTGKLSFGCQIEWHLLDIISNLFQNLKWGPKSIPQNKVTTLSECCISLAQWSGLKGASCGGSSFTGIRKRLLIHDRSLFSQYAPSSHTKVLNVNLKGLKSPEVARFSESILETKYSPKRRMQIANRILTTGHRAPPLSWEGISDIKFIIDILSWHEFLDQLV